MTWAAHADRELVAVAPRPAVRRLELWRSIEEGFWVCACGLPHAGKERPRWCERCLGTSFEWRGPTL